MADTDRCHTCDRPRATEEDWARCASGCSCVRCRAVCWDGDVGGSQCSSSAVDWRGRALAGEAHNRHLAASTLREVQGAVAWAARWKAAAKRLRGERDWHVHNGMEALACVVDENNALWERAEALERLVWALLVERKAQVSYRVALTEWAMAEMDGCYEEQEIEALGDKRDGAWGRLCKRTPKVERALAALVALDAGSPGAEGSEP